jgi:CBS domain-containing protein
LNTQTAQQSQEALMQNQLVLDWMTPDPITVPSSTTLPEAHDLMQKHKIRRLLVVDDGELMGIVTRGDIRGAEPSEATSLSIFEIHYLLSRLTLDKIMTRNVIAVSPDDPVGKAARLMYENKIAGLPVVDEGSVVGIITESDVFRMVVELWEREGSGG